ncbi:unnamed protein product [Rhizophagus irregularis]|uniref:Uncharacterized protein n=1 Tax=Rhizophagus irregularis TaxID=588596 RepID=A0A915Z8Z8_9GLOM|nr:unnamed protein product [Rhizophagus irregularis]CAB5117998.1 unnamed protein product [Rhizophagus irregularis]CAB5366497.1 unnamed protein product [Rhizophagus irregularis]
MDWCICILCALSKKFGLFIIVISNICKKVLRILSLLFSIIFMVTYATSFFYNGVKSSDVVNLLIAFVNDIYTKTSENSDMHDTLHSLNSPPGRDRTDSQSLRFDI